MRPVKKRAGTRRERCSRRGREPASHDPGKADPPWIDVGDASSGRYYWWVDDRWSLDQRPMCQTRRTWETRVTRSFGGEVRHDFWRFQWTSGEPEADFRPAKVFSGRTTKTRETRSSMCVFQRVFRRSREAISGGFSVKSLKV
jgi:hypothetical protein